MIEATVTFEMIGSPKEFIDKTLKEIVQKVKAHKGPTVKRSEVFKAKKQGEMFSAFAELEMGFNDSKELRAFCFDFTPSNIQVTEPGTISLEALEFSDFMNDYLQHMHDVYLELKNLHANNKLLNTNVVNLVKNIIMLSLYDFDKTIQQISKSVGISEKDLAPFMQELLKDNKIVHQKGVFKLIKESKK